MKKFARLIVVLLSLNPTFFLAADQNKEFKVFVSLTAWENEPGKNDGHNPHRFYALLEPRLLKSPLDNLVCSAKVGSYDYRIVFGAEEWTTKNPSDIHSWLLTAGQIVNGGYASHLSTVIVLPLAHKSGNVWLDSALPAAYSVSVIPATDEKEISFHVGWAENLHSQKLPCSVSPTN